MSITVAGFVKNGVVVPNAPLPEGALVEVHKGSILSIAPNFDEPLEEFRE